MKKGCNVDTGELKTVAPDPRWPQQNQTYACFTMFTDYHRCIRLLSEKHDTCEYFRYCYERLCPNAWVDKWCEQLQENTFPFPLPKPCNKKKK
ncbi:cytochrome c oxidase subunit 6b-2-like [Agrilus planipennis]|uniref:Cytochrome c oxidase subunit 6b-2-like n=1 Tax=Agrilus planipennis TaxID=224129 RepID=A0A1W4WW04_AGRPL|nr:cytochrome c oxidase subunit 6b-2-like [Agrilus planipennis]